MQPRVVQEWVLHLCMPLLCTGLYGRTGMVPGYLNKFEFNEVFLDNVRGVLNSWSQLDQGKSPIILAKVE